MTRITWPSPPRPLAACAAAAAVVLAAACGGGGGGAALPQAPDANRYAAAQRVTTAPALSALAGGLWHLCGRTADGQAWCWGSNEYGQLGAASPAEVTCPVGVACSPVPRRVAAAQSPLVQVEASARHSCALDASGAAWCWGFGLGGQLGDGRRSDSRAPVAVAGGLQFTALDAGQDGMGSCGVTGAGAVWCWGPFAGSSRMTGSDVPMPVPLPQPASAVAVGTRHACVLDLGGQAWCWGDAPLLGNGAASGGSSTPVAVSGPQRYTAIAAAESSSCALAADGQAWCWGAAPYTGSGPGDADRLLPTPVSTPQRFVQLSLAGTQACGLTAAGEAWCWGDDWQDAGSVVNRRTPVLLAGTQRYSAIALSAVSGCGVATGDGALWCWGSNATGAVGQPIQP
jgi:alpha-tubulin suppressor-like RCC1 family protein